MASLPPYSTYRTDSKQMMYPQATSHGNLLTFTPPGFKQTLNVKYPDSRLAVCHKCKKNFKTRDMCRVRNTHTAPPWTTAYVCITMDESCTDADGKYVDKPLTLRMVQWQPYAVKKNFGPKTPVCSACKRTNRTKSFCRERHKHRHLPWCTVYVLLSTLDNADPTTVVAGASKPSGESPPPSAAKMPAGTPPTDSSSTTASPAEAEKKVKTEIATEPPDVGDDINAIPESRTFLALVSSRGCSIHWLDLVEYEESMQPNSFESSFSSPTPVPQPPTPHAALVPDAPQYYAAAYAQQQSALKNQQQYFFQLQQQQQQQQLQIQRSPHAYATQQWQQYNPLAGTGGEMAHPTAGEAAAARRRDEMVPPTPTMHHWPPVYYAHHAAAASNMYAPPHMMIGSPPAMAPGMGQQQQQQAPSRPPMDNGTGDAYHPPETHTAEQQQQQQETDENNHHPHHPHDEEDEEERDTKRLRSA